jgi:hypothetical protein
MNASTLSGWRVTISSSRRNCTSASHFELAETVKSENLGRVRERDRWGVLPAECAYGPRILFVYGYATLMLLAQSIHFGAGCRRA